MDTRLRNLPRSWRDAAPQTRRRLLLMLAMLLAAGVQAMVWLWTIDDAAISFSYARNLAHGHGLVAQVGAERVEGYSNPLWVLLLSAWELVGIGGFAASKLMGLAFGVACVPLVWSIARWSRPDRDESVPLFAAFALAANVQFGIWSTSGLENALFGLLLAAAIWRTLIETRTRGFPWSALLYLGISLTRPEGIAYAALGGFAAMTFAWRDGRGLRPALLWGTVFVVPFAIYHAIRIDYFAWTFPNTYYAKLGHKTAAPLDWHAAGWTYLRRYAGWTVETGTPGPGLGQGYLVPLYVLGAVGAAGRRGWVAAAVATGLLLLPGPAELPAVAAIDPGEWLARAGVLANADAWMRIRVLLLIALALAVPFLARPSTGGRARTLCWGTAVVSLAFAIGSNGDWMPGYRWLSFAAVPIAVLAAAGLGEVRDTIRRLAPARPTVGRVAAFAVLAALAALYAIPQARHIGWFTWRTPISASSVHQRVEYLDHLMDTLHLDHAVVLDIDMGGHVYWSRAEMIDLAGLIDVPLARHHFDREFTSEYLFRERRPDFAHVHGPWAKKTQMAKHPEWGAQYLALPGYLGSGGVHSGNHVRRDHLFTRAWHGSPGRRVTFANGAAIAGVDLPGLPTAPGLELFVELGLEKPRAEAPAADAPDFQVEIFLSNASGVAARTIVAPGYGWLAPADWRDGDIFVGRYTLPLGARVPPGEYDLGFVLRDDRGGVIPAVAPARRAATPRGRPVVGGVGGVAPAVAVGEVRFPKAVTVSPYRFVLDRNQANAAAARRLAGELECSGAEARWLRARRRMVHRSDRLAANDPPVHRALADCWIALAAGSADREEQAEWVAHARRLDPETPALQTTARRLAAALFDAGERAHAAEDWSESYRFFRAAVRIDPRLAWARRYAEEARIHRLALTTQVHAW